jgi:hypothetical protein
MSNVDRTGALEMFRVPRGIRGCTSSYLGTKECTIPEVGKSVAVQVPYPGSYTSTSGEDVMNGVSTDQPIIGAIALS